MSKEAKATIREDSLRAPVLYKGKEEVKIVVGHPVTIEGFQPRDPQDGTQACGTVDGVSARLYWCNGGWQFYKPLEIEPPCGCGNDITFFARCGNRTYTLTCGGD